MTYREKRLHKKDMELSKEAIKNATIYGAIGAAVGSVVPFLGTALGGALGASLGGISKLPDSIKLTKEFNKKIANYIKINISEMANTLLNKKI